MLDFQRMIARTIFRFLFVFLLGGGLVSLGGCRTGDRGALPAPEVEDSLGPTRLQEESPAAAREAENRDGWVNILADKWPKEPGEPLELSLEEAVFLALGHNRALSVEQLSPIIAGTFEEVERSLYDPSVFVGGGYSQARGVRLLPELEQRFSVETKGYYFEGGISKRFLSGTNVELGARQDWRASGSDSGQHEVRTGLSVTQALLQGRGREGNLASIRQARLDARISEYELRGFTEAFVNRVETAYWNFSLAEQELEIFESSLEVADRQLQEAVERVDAGALPRTELAAARAEKARRNQALIEARSRSSQGRIELLRLMNPGGAVNWETAVVVEPVLKPKEAALDPIADHVGLAREMRPEMSEARLRLARGELEVTRTLDGLLPRLQLFIDLGKTGFAEAFTDAARDLDGEGFDVTAGLRLEYPIGNRGAKARHRAATVSRHQAGLALENLAQLVEADIRSAYIEVSRARQQIGATAVTRELQEEVLRAEEVRFSTGISTALLVAQAQRDLLAAQLDEVRSVTDYRLALINLYRLDGSLLLRRGIGAPGELPWR